MNVVKVVLKLNVFNILIDKSIIHGKEKKVEYIQSFQREEFKKGGNPNVTQLIKLIDVRDVSPNTWTCKAFFDRYFDLIKEHDMDENELNKFILIWMDRAWTNTGCNGNFFTRLVEEHSHFRTLWCIICKFELAIKESVSKELLMISKKFNEILLLTL